MFTFLLSRELKKNVIEFTKKAINLSKTGFHQTSKELYIQGKVKMLKLNLFLCKN